MTQMTPSALALILQNEKHADLTCFDIIIVGGARLYAEIKTQSQVCYFFAKNMYPFRAVLTVVQNNSV